MKEEIKGIPINILIIGEKTEGKSSFIKNFVEGEGKFNKAENDISYAYRVENVNGLIIRFNIYNSSSESEFKKIVPTVKIPDAIIFVCDQTNRDSFELLETKWRKLVVECFPNLTLLNIMFMTIGDEKKKK